MARTEVKLNHSAIQEYLDGDHGIEAMLREHAEKVLAAAKQDAEGYVVTGNYLAGLEISSDHTDRLVYRVKGTAPHSHLVEANHGTLSRALDSA